MNSSFPSSELDQGPPLIATGQERIRTAHIGENSFIDPLIKKRSVRKNTLQAKNQAAQNWIWRIKQIMIKCPKLYLLLALCWLMGIIRLFTMDKGIIDYVQMQQIIDDRKLQLEQVNAENSNIAQEINRIEKDTKYQRFLAREHLGVIGEQEYLVLFAPKASLRSK